MSHHHEDSEYKNAGEAIRAAEEALEARRYDDAKHLIVLAEKMNGENSRTQKLLRRVRVEESEAEKRLHTSGTVGCLGSSFCYLLLSFLLFPFGASRILWLLVAFLMLPAFFGRVVGRRMGYDTPPKRRFWKAFGAVGGATWAYTFYNLVFWRSRFSLNSAGADIIFVWLIIPTLYGVLTGVIAGLVSAHLAWKKEERDS